MRTETSVLIGPYPVRRIGFGTVRLLGPDLWGPVRHPRAAARLLQEAAECCDLIDVADCYGPGTVELCISRSLKKTRPGLILATKGGQTCTRPGQWEPAGRPEQLTAACEASLRRLDIETVGLYQLHVVDPRVPIEESVGAIADLASRGLVDQIGVCNVTPDQLLRAQSVAPIATVQNRLNLLETESLETVAACDKSGAAFLAWYPLFNGRLSARAALQSVAIRHDATPSQVAIAWLLATAPSVVPIPGTSSLIHLRENVDSAQIVLSNDEMTSLAEATHS